MRIRFERKIVIIISRVFFCFDLLYCPLFSIDVDGADIRLIHFIKRINNGLKIGGGSMIVYRGQRSFSFFFSSSLPRRTVAGGFARGERKERTKERKGCTLRA